MPFTAPRSVSTGTSVNTPCSLNFQTWLIEFKGSGGGEVTPTLRSSGLLRVGADATNSPDNNHRLVNFAGRSIKSWRNDEALGTFVSFRFPSLFCLRPRQHSSTPSTTSCHPTPPPIPVSLAERISLQPWRHRGWKPSRDFSAALLDAALNNPRSRPARRQRFYITSKHLYGDRSGFIALSSSTCTSQRRHQREKLLAPKFHQGINGYLFNFKKRASKGRAQSTLIVTSARPHFCSLSCRESSQILSAGAPNQDRVFSLFIQRPFPPLAWKGLALNF